MTEQDDEPRFLRPEEVKPVDVEEFSFALAVGGAAYAYRMPMSSPSENKILLEDEEGNIEEIRLTDVPLNRAALAIRDQCRGDMEMFQSIMHRVFAFMNLRNHEKMQRWTKQSDDPEQIGIHSAVIEAAATLPLDQYGHFEPNRFFQTVEVIAASGKYDDAEDPESKD